MSPDPLTVHGLGADLNVYAYVSGQVLKNVDPLGLDPTNASSEQVRQNADGSVQTAEGSKVWVLAETEIRPRDPTKTASGEDWAQAYGATLRQNEAKAPGPSETAPSASWLDRPAGGGHTPREIIEMNPYMGGLSSKGFGLLGRAFKWVGTKLGAADDVVQVATAGGPKINVWRMSSKPAPKGGAAPSPRVAFGKSRWEALEPGSKACQSGCETAARTIQRAIGGEIRTIKPPGPVDRLVLGRVKDSKGVFRNPAGDKARGWSTHQVVVKDGRVYDRLTGPKGQSIKSYKARWEEADAIHFGF